MSMFLQVSVQSGVLQAQVTGTFSLAEAQALFMEILETAVQHAAQKILIDGRELQGNVEAFERFRFHEFAARAVAEHTLRGLWHAPPRIVYVLNTPVLDPRGFGEDVARNRGMIVKVCDDLESARAWLGLAPAPPSTRGNRA